MNLLKKRIAVLEGRSRNTAYVTLAAIILWPR